MVQGWKEEDRVRVTGSCTVIFYSRLSIQTKRSGAHCASIHPTHNSESQAAYNSWSGIVSPGDSSSRSVSPYPCFPLPGGFYPVPLCQLLKWDTGVYHLHLTYLYQSYPVSLSLSLSHCRLRWTTPPLPQWHSHGSRKQGACLGPGYFWGLVLYNIYIIEYNILYCPISGNSSWTTMSWTVHYITSNPFSSICI